MSIAYKTRDCDNVQGNALISSSGLYIVEDISLNAYRSTGVETVFSTTFDVESYGIFWIGLAFSLSAETQEQPIIEISSVVLTKSIGKTDRNLVEYGGFSATYIDSSSVSVPVSEFWAHSSGASATIENDTVFGSVLKVNGSITSTVTVKHRIYEATDEEIAKYDTTPSYTNAGHEYIVSGFAKTSKICRGTSSSFSINIVVTYYLGANEGTATKTFVYPFLSECTTWQFTGGSFNTIQRDSNDNLLRFVKSIDVYCNYSNQDGGYALFDNISVVHAGGSEIKRYEYYTNGLLMTAGDNRYKEYYEYYSNRNVEYVATSDGKITYYRYDSNNPNQPSLSWEYTYNGSVERIDAFANEE